MRYTYLPLLALTLMLSSCLTEETITLTPETEQEVIVETESDNANFLIGNADVQLDYGYIHSVPAANGSEFLHRVVLTRTDVREGNHLTGISDALTVTFESPDGDLEGVYPTAVASAGDRITKASRFYSSLDFTENINSPQIQFYDGELTVTTTDEGYNLSFSFLDQWASVEMTGHFNGQLQEVMPAPEFIPSTEDFEGDNTLIIGESETPLTNAYLVKQYEDGEGQPVYKLVVSEQELSAGEVLSGVSSALMYNFNMAGDLLSGRYSWGGSGGDFLSNTQQALFYAPLYCTNFNFDTGSFDDDDYTEGETLIYRDGEEFMFRFTGTIRNDELIDGIYRGPLTVID